MGSSGEKAKMSALYDTIYRITSGDAVHTTVLALNRHVQADDHGTIGHLTFRPENRDLAVTLSFAANALLYAMEAVGPALGGLLLPIMGPAMLLRLQASQLGLVPMRLISILLPLDIELDSSPLLSDF
jgi:hypothetical protein